MEVRAADREPLESGVDGEIEDAPDGVVFEIGADRREVMHVGADIELVGYADAELVGRITPLWLQQLGRSFVRVGGVKEEILGSPSGEAAEITIVLARSSGERAKKLPVALQPSVERAATLLPW